MGVSIICGVDMVFLDILLRFDCPTEPSDTLVACLQGVNQHVLDSQYSEFAVSIIDQCHCSLQ